MQVFEAALRVHVRPLRTDTRGIGPPWGPTAKVERENMNNIARKVAIAVFTATLSVGILGISAPAHADTVWPGHSLKR